MLFQFFSEKIDLTVLRCAQRRLLRVPVVGSPSSGVTTALRDLNWCISIDLSSVLLALLDDLIEVQKI